LHLIFSNVISFLGEHFVMGEARRDSPLALVGC
jgi:hypothetical protein